MKHPVAALATEEQASLKAPKSPGFFKRLVSTLIPSLATRCRCWTTWWIIVERCQTPLVWINSRQRRRDLLSSYAHPHAFIIGDTYKQNPLLRVAREVDLEIRWIESDSWKRIRETLDDHNPGNLLTYMKLKRCSYSSDDFLSLNSFFPYRYHSFHFFFGSTIVSLVESILSVVNRPI